MIDNRVLESFKLGQMDIINKILDLYKDEEPYEEIFVCALRRTLKKLYKEIDNE